MPIKGRVIKKALLKKGFVRNKKIESDHEIYSIINPKTGKWIETKFSRGAKGDGELGTIWFPSFPKN